MTSFFADLLSFTSWLESKTESELKSKLYRADPRSRLNGSKSDLVNRLVASTRNLGFERQQSIFPELRRRRQQDQRPRIAAIRQLEREVSETVQAATRHLGGPTQYVQARSEVRHVLNLGGAIPRVQAAVRAMPSVQASVRTMPRAQPEGRRIPRAQAVETIPRVQTVVRNSVTTASNSRPVPTFHTFRMRTLQQEARDLTPMRPGLRNPRNIMSDLPGNTGVVRTPEQILRETLEAHAGLIIQSINQSITPRHRLSSMSLMGAAAPSPSRPRAASISSTEKRGPEVSLVDDKYQVKLECKICFDSPVNTVLLPCGHACCCQDCSIKLKFATWDSKCPICRTKIQNISMLYFS